MAPESGTGPAPATTRGGIEAGNASADEGARRLNPESPYYPAGWRERRLAGYGDQMERSEDLAEIVRRLGPAPTHGRDRRPWIARLLAEAGRDRPEGGADLGRFVAGIRNFLYHEVKNARPINAPLDARVAYVAERVLPPDFAALVAAPAAPVDVLLNAGEEDTFAPLPPKHFAIIFAGASWTDIEQVKPWVVEEQRRLGYPDRGGRPGRGKRRNVAASAEQARVAAKLHHWRGWSYDQIAAFFGWSGRETVRRFVRDGEGLLASEVGPEWKTQPPPIVVEGG